MTTSPYDNLPTGKEEENKNQLHYVDEKIYEPVTPEVQPEMQETSDQLHYVDVEVEKAEPLESSSKPATPQQAKPTPAPVNPRGSQHPSTPMQTPTFPKTTSLEKPPRYSSLNVKNLRSVGEYTLPFEESLLVPDTMPDMEKLLFAEGSVHVAQPQKQSYGKDDFLAGDITVYTVYQPASQEHSPVDVVKSVIPFKTDKCWSSTENAHFKAAVSIKNISAEMVNERKFTVKGQLLIKTTEISQQDIKLFQGVDDTDFVEAKRNICITDLNFETQESTEISQDINIKENQPAPLKILKESIHIIENHRQITSGKLVINATIHTQALYLGEENGEKQLCCLTNKTDFTQFVLMKEAVDSNLINITFTWDDLKLSIENQNMFLLKGTVTSFICGYKARELTTTFDAYHKTRELIFDAQSQELSCVKDTVSGEISAREVINLPEAAENLETLLCGSGQLSNIDTRWERGRIVIEGEAPVKILALSEDGKPFVIEACLPLRGSLETTVDSKDFDVCSSAVLKDLWFDNINSRQLEINVSIAINIWLLGKEAYITPENLRFAESDTPVQRISMAVYVTGQNDTLWDVAKRYKSDIETIAELNQLDSQKPLPEGMKLFICG